MMQPTRLRDQTMLSQAAAPVEAEALGSGILRYFLTDAEAEVELESGERIGARQAASCLLQPRVDDRVLIFREGSRAYILSVLSRESGSDAALSVPGAVDVTLSAPRRLGLSAPEINLVSRSAILAADSLQAFGKTLVTRFQTVIQAASQMTTSAAALVIQADTRTTRVEQTDMLRAGTLIEQADGVASRTSETALHVARQDMHLNAQRVNVS